jgi:hypothetical protein
MIESLILGSVNRLAISERYDIDIAIDGLVVRRLRHGARIIVANLVSFRARGARCRRILTSSEGERFVVKQANFTDAYEPAVTGVIRADDGVIVDGQLNPRERNSRGHRRRICARGRSQAGAS